MILYYHAGACSLADHIALVEADLPFSLVAIDEQKRTDDGRDYLTINPRGFVPALELDDGAVLTENAAILAYIADRSGKLLPAPGLDRWRVLEAVSFMTTEIHGNMKPFFMPDSTPAQKQKASQILARHFATLDAQRGDRPFLIGDRMTIADPYLFVMLMWGIRQGVDIPQRLHAYHAGMAKQPSVAKALVAEGLA